MNGGTRGEPRASAEPASARATQASSLYDPCFCCRGTALRTCGRPPGSGKTTFLKSLAGLTRHAKGLKVIACRYVLTRVFAPPPLTLLAWPSSLYASPLLTGATHAALCSKRRQS